MKILTDSELFSPEEIAKMEKHYNAKYVCETCVRGGGYRGWRNEPVAVFYQEDDSKVPEGGSQWFGLFVKHNFDSDGGHLDYDLIITNAISALEPFDGIVAKNGDVIYSKYRHDYRYSPDNSVMIDGGRDYTKNNGGGPIVRLAILKDKLCIV